MAGRTYISKFEALQRASSTEDQPRKPQRPKSSSTGKASSHVSKRTGSSTRCSGEKSSGHNKKSRPSNKTDHYTGEKVYSEVSDSSPTLMPPDRYTGEKHVHHYSGENLSPDEVDHLPTHTLQEVLIQQQKLAEARTGTSTFP